MEADPAEGGPDGAVINSRAGRKVEALEGAVPPEDSREGSMAKQPEGPPLQVIDTQELPADEPPGLAIPWIWESIKDMNQDVCGKSGQYRAARGIVSHLSVDFGAGRRRDGGMSPCSISDRNNDRMPRHSNALRWEQRGRSRREGSDGARGGRS